MALVDELGWHSEHPVTGKLVLTNPKGLRAAEALEKLNGYARHTRSCATNDRLDRENGCDCGLSTLLAQIFGETSDGAV